MRAFTAVSRAIFTWRIISTAPSADFGIALAWPASTSRAAASASTVSDLPADRRVRRSAIHLDHAVARAAHGAGQPGPVASCAFDAKRLDPSEAGGPFNELRVTAGIGRKRLMAEAHTPRIDIRASHPPTESRRGERARGVIEPIISAVPRRISHGKLAQIVQHGRPRRRRQVFVEGDLIGGDQRRSVAIAWARAHDEKFRNSSGERRGVARLRCGN